jgi:hypothetical protein
MNGEMVLLGLVVVPNPTGANSERAADSSAVLMLHIFNTELRIS